MLRSCFVPTAEQRVRQNLLVQFEPRSETIVLGNPWKRTWHSRKRCAQASGSMLAIASRVTFFVRRSWTTRRLVALSRPVGGRPTIKSIARSLRGRSGIGSSLRKPYLALRQIVAPPHPSQLRENRRTSYKMPGQKKRLPTSFNIASLPRCPAIAASWWL